MPYDGHRYRPREAAALIAKKWQNVDERHKGLATMLGESQCFVGATHENYGNDAELDSVDLGLLQISIEAEKLDLFKDKLWTASLDPEIYEPVAATNVGWARAMYDAPGPIDGKRRWGPWVAYISGWATHPEWWVWKHVRDPQSGELVPVGPWIGTGRFIQAAIVGWANWHLLIAKTKNANGAVASAYNAQVRWKVKGELGLSAGKVAWLQHPPRPEEPPANGVGPRPVPNNGR
jgi:hypothetical protein